MRNNNKIASDLSFPVYPDESYMKRAKWWMVMEGVEGREENWDGRYLLYLSFFFPIYIYIYTRFNFVRDLQLSYRLKEDEKRIVGYRQRANTHEMIESVLSNTGEIIWFSGVDKAYDA